MARWIFFAVGWITLLAVADNTTLLRTVESSVNEISSLQARFSHQDSGGRFYQGTLSLKRPWHLRMQYDTPSPFLIVSDGRSLIYEDHSTQEAIYLPLESSPLSFLLDTETNLQKVFQIEDIQEKEDQIIFDCRDKRNYFSLVLIFSKKEKSIIGWITKDAQGNEIKIALHALKKNVPLRDSLFQFQQKPRWLTKSKERK